MKQSRPERRQGQAVVRGRLVPRSTHDQRLLARQGPSDWVHMDPWRVLRIQAEFVEGFGQLAELPQAVTVFGSARTAEGTSDYQTGRALGRALAEAGYAVITGGGPGVMESANRGASEVDGAMSVGLGIELPFEQRMNDYVDLGVEFRYFFVRKTMFVKYSCGFIALPGGFGTLDELFEALTLVQTHKVTSFPVVLMGSEFWGGLLDWIKGSLLGTGKIAPQDLDLISVTDDVHEAVRIIVDADLARSRQREEEMEAAEAQYAEPQ
ncbi:TIGR00730 family Rossman fold protein [Nonomuraea phyllanthi]|uniref:Cytokinin riboside 5'-monophosphate phosphoribohydrolase n=1 Tax=Nonomuraea phyllanthi TaxID=2219224 RepID=A0A5C4VDJ1_9ACTN|nr:TIGR00730 family Rossman fold protein [Nonomuraea phyllanthi]KAB8191264.1 TIGR00730 family Rossman fold protein [Nonomuraea phyllanthi]QFY12676.1 TIGR00730 family Rossman fold protein [Nonomuraea phyllanthi]